MPDSMEQRVVGLLNFLHAYVRLRSPAPRTLENEPEVLWLHELRNTEGCTGRALARAGANTNTDDDKDTPWLEVHKPPPRPTPPPVPKECREWLADPDGLDKPQHEPQLRQTLDPPPSSQWPPANPPPGGIPPVAPPVRRRLQDEPRVQRAWQQYLENRWRPWAERARRWDAQRRAYAALHRIYQERKNREEQRELVLGLGLLCWRTNQNAPVRRHVIIARADLEAIAHFSAFKIWPRDDGEVLSLELEMLDPKQIPQDVQDHAQQQIREALDDPFDHAHISAALRTLAHGLHADGRYEAAAWIPDDAGLEAAPAIPVIRYAPALILRKRRTQGVLRTIETLIETLEKRGAFFPQPIRTLFEPAGDKEHNQSASHTEHSGDASIYLPLKTNDQQSQIVKRLNQAHGVLVQGPPGTGKSHTIANLICHLLACGQRVLVTAWAGRALNVLCGPHGMVPEPLRPLCVGLLGESLEEERRHLEQSVGSILDRYQQEGHDPHARQHAIRQAQKHLEKCRRRKAELDNTLCSLRERETRSHTWGCEEYTGTAARIAERLNEEQPDLGWIDDRPRSAEPPLTTDEFRELVNLLLQDLTPEREQAARQRIPEQNKLLSPEQFAALVEHEREARQELEQIQPQGAEHGHRQMLSAGSEKHVRTLHEALDALLTRWNEVEHTHAASCAWLRQAVREILARDENEWHARCEATERQLTRLERSRQAEPAHVVRGLDNRPLASVLEHARVLRQYLPPGSRLTSFRYAWWRIMAPLAVREALYVGRQITVDGALCDCHETLERLERHLDAVCTLEETWALWSGWTERVSGPTQLQLAALRQHYFALRAVLELKTLRQQAQQAAKRIAGLPAPNWADREGLESLRLDAKWAMAHIRSTQAQKQLGAFQETLERLLTDPRVHHEAVRRVRDAVRVRNVQKYATSIEVLRTLRSDRARLERRDDLLKRLRQHAPRLAEKMRAIQDPPTWSARVTNWIRAWKWAVARGELDDFLNQNAESLCAELHKVEKEIEQATILLIERLAWDYCLTRLTQAHVAHLEGWQQAVRRLGRGTGRHAEHWRTAARRHLEGCREAIPVWVIPWHRLHATSELAPDMFDVVIVDEASQCDLEAALLLLVGKKIVVIGDDMQISPETGFVDNQDVFALQQEHLGGWIHRDVFSPGNSLFGIAARFFGSRIVLREHFRCMPEIITFSNRLCYRDMLIPLRQYSPNRLEPLRLYHTTDGHREGFTNTREAEALVDQLRRCCQDERYTRDGRPLTMGVISLLGEPQAQCIQDLLLDQLGPAEIEQRRIVCGDAYAFQGDERDVMFLSMVATPQEPGGYMTRERDLRRFNVAVSRARDQVWLFHTATANDFHPDDVRRKLLEYFSKPPTINDGGLTPQAIAQLELQASRRPRPPGDQPPPFESWFEVDVCLHITRRGYRVVPQYQMLGHPYRIDLLIQDQNRRLAVECDGDAWHGPEQYRRDEFRRRQLERAGLPVWRIWASEFYANPRQALEGLWRMLDRIGIRPGGSD